VARTESRATDVDCIGTMQDGFAADLGSFGGRQSSSW
jgi:hypothetical protein